MERRGDLRYICTSPSGMVAVATATAARVDRQDNRMQGDEIGSHCVISRPQKRLGGARRAHRGVARRDAPLRALPGPRRVPGTLHSSKKNRENTLPLLLKTGTGRHNSLYSRIRVRRIQAIRPRRSVHPLNDH